MQSARKSLDGHYSGVSPQLLARVRQNWSALSIDLDAVWRDTMHALPGFAELDALPVFPESRPVDLLLLFDQGCCWVDTLRHVCLMLQARGGEGKLTPQQVQGLIAVTARLRDELAAVRMLTVAGLSMPAMQIARSISEDVDLALLLLIRKKHAASFVDCRSPEEAAEFWRRHIAGGRAFRLVAQALYRFGLDFSNDSDYARWRKEVLVFLGSVVHTSVVHPTQAGPGPDAGLQPGRGQGLDAAAQECLYFATIRVQELCAYSLVLGAGLREDLATLAPAPGLETDRLRLARFGGDIIVDQMRWLTDTRDTDPQTDPQTGPQTDPEQLH
ncbi:MAG: hypothetical protein AAF074_02550 [Pseudomonadota bacterium]